MLKTMNNNIPINGRDTNKGYTQKIYALDRIGGEAEFLIYHDNEKVVDAYFISTAPIRGFEKLVLGKSPLFVIEAVMRICGICHASHGIAAAEAIEDAIGIMPPTNGRVLREAVGLVNRVQSHLLHLTLLVPDIVTSKENKHHLLIDTIRIINKVNELMTKLGGSPTHPPHITVGGMTKPPKDSVMNEVVRLTKNLSADIAKLLETIVDMMEEGKGKISLLKDIRIRHNYLASHLFYGDRYNISVDDIKVMRYDALRPSSPDYVKKRNTTLVAIYKDKMMEVGPRARMTLYRDMRDDSLLGLQRLRIQDTLLSLERIEELLTRVVTNEPVKTPIVFRQGKGIGVFEAPRGTLIHKVELDNDGRVTKYRIIVPTMFNIPVIEKSAMGVSPEVAELVPRIYDPCIPCTTHLIKVV